MGNMRFSKQKIWENYGSFMRFTVQNIGEIVVNLSCKFKYDALTEYK